MVCSGGKVVCGGGGKVVCGGGVWVVCGVVWVFFGGRVGAFDGVRVLGRIYVLGGCGVKDVVCGRWGVDGDVGVVVEWAFVA